MFLFEFLFAGLYTVGRMFLRNGQGYYSVSGMRRSLENGQVH